jgi:hypothetical protein
MSRFRNGEQYAANSFAAVVGSFLRSGISGDTSQQEQYRGRFSPTASTGAWNGSLEQELEQ